MTGRTPIILISILMSIFASTDGHTAKIPVHSLESGPVKIRVRIREKTPGLRIRGFDLRVAGHFFNQRTDWSVSCERGVRVEGRSPIAPGDVAEFTSPGGFLFVDGRPYRDVVRVHALQDGGCQVVNVVELETYLDGLVSAEFSPRWSPESVAAQIVAARTYAYHQLLNARKDPKSLYDVESTVRDQVYEGSSGEDYRASLGVAKTRGMILTASADSRQPLPIKAFYHSTCGGMTELPERVWGRSLAGFKKRVPCQFCQASPAYRWSSLYSPREFADALYKGALRSGRPSSWSKSWKTVLASARLRSVSVIDSGIDGRVGMFDTLWDSPFGPTHLKVAGAVLRDWLGPARFRSTAFGVQVTASGIRFDGRGNGHGVGLCQWGAKIMGDRGQAMAAILQHYYPDARLVRAW